MNISASRRFAVWMSFLLLGMLALTAQPKVNYHLIKKVPLGAAPGGKEYFDYLISEGALKPEWFLSSIEAGSEIASGKGEITFRRFVVH